MVLLGLLLILGTTGLSFAVVRANQDIFTAPGGTIELLGYQTDATVGQIFGAGAVAGALFLLGLMMLFSGIGRGARRRSAARSELAAERAAREDAERAAAQERAAREDVVAASSR